MDNITENNKLIAEFMGYVKNCTDKDFTFYTHPDGKGIIIQSHYDCDRFISHKLMEARGFIFNRSWDWLMPVVEKIESLGYSLEIKLTWCRIKQIENGSVIILRWEEDITKIEAVYNVCVEFIKWYNEQNKNNESL